MFFNRLSKKTDEELMVLVQQGEERAFTLLYHRYCKKILRYFYRMLWKDENKAQDFLHDVFVKIIEDPSRYNVSKPFTTWIYSVAHNMCKNEYRKHKFRQEINGRIATHTEVIESKVHEELDHARLSKAVEELLDHFDDEDKNLFVLRCELEMPLAEIAIILNCPEGTVKSRWFYLKKKLAESLHDYNPALK